MKSVSSVTSSPIRCKGSPQHGQVVTSGGRVLTVVGEGKDFRQATSRAYEAANRIHFEGMTYRRDIGARALARLHGSRPA